MKPINLISAERRLQQQRATCMIRWAGGLAVWGTTVAVGCIAVLALSNLESDIESTRSAIVLRTTTAQANAAASRSAIESVNRRLSVSRAVRRLPDWSVLLPVVSSVLGEEIALERIVLEPIRGEQSTERATLVLSGVGTSRAALSEFVMRLEGTGAFSRVETTTAQRRPIRDHEFFAFELHCRVGSGWEGTAP
ncbi:MAG: PilN domain-containing protein [Phycisphaerales bacterium]